MVSSAIRPPRVSRGGTVNKTERTIEADGVVVAPVRAEHRRPSEKLIQHAAERGLIGLAGEPEQMPEFGRFDVRGCKFANLHECPPCFVGLLASTHGGLRVSAGAARAYLPVPMRAAGSPARASLIHGGALR